jgi:hypothetical protein
VTWGQAWNQFISAWLAKRQSDANAYIQELVTIFQGNPTLQSCPNAAQRILTNFGNINTYQFPASWSTPVS